MELGKLGVAFALYFEYIVVCMGLLILMFSMVGVHALINNDEGHVCKSYANSKEHPCRGGFTILYSLANRDDPRVFRVSSILNLIFVVVALIGAFFYRKMQAVTTEKIDSRLTTASDYTVMVYGISKTYDSKKIKELINGKNNENGLAIRSVSMSYLIGPLISLYRKKGRLEKKNKELFDKEQAKIEKERERCVQREEKKSATEKKRFEEKLDMLKKKRIRVPSQQAVLDRQIELLSKQEQIRVQAVEERIKQMNAELDNRKESLYEKDADKPTKDEDSFPEKEALEGKVEVYDEKQKEVEKGKPVEKRMKNLLSQKEKDRFKFIEENIELQLEQLNDKSKVSFTGIAFVTFETEEGKIFEKYDSQRV